MTLDQFLAKLRKTPRKWNVDYDGRLRLGKSCPITAVVEPKLRAAKWEIVAVEIGLQKQTASRIVAAADSGYFYKALRKKLFKACGLVKLRP